MTAEDAMAGQGLPSSGDIRALSKQMGVMHDALRKVWALIIFLVVVALGLGIWCAVQQATLDGKDHTISQLSQQNAANARRDAAFARMNCESGNRYKASMRAVFNDYTPLVTYKSAADAAKVARVAAEVRAGTAPRDCAALALKVASGQ